MTTPDLPASAPAPTPAPVAAPAPPPPKPHWRKLHAFGLPAGSIRALLAVAIFAGIWVWLWWRPDQEVPQYLQNLMFIIMGHYFAARAKASAGPEAGPPPLFLPRGSVRLLLVAGFFTVAGLLIYQHRLVVQDPDTAAPRLNHAGVTLILVFGFLLGVVLARVADWFSPDDRPPPRILEDVRAAVSLGAAVLMLVLMFNLWSVPETETLSSAQRFFVKYRVEDVLAAVVGFYFGSRS